MNNYEFIPNFKPAEFACPDKCSSNPDMSIYLLIMLQTVRNKYKKPVNITSGYRCQKYNDKLEGSVKNSDHMQRKAADFYIPGQTDTLEKRKQVIEAIRYIPGFKYAYCNGYILYANGTSKVYNAPWMGSSIHISVK